MKMASCAVSVVSALSSTATEYSIKSFPFSINSACKSKTRSHIQSATVFVLKPTFENACVFLWTQDAAHFNHGLFQKLFLHLLCYYKTCFHSSSLALLWCDIRLSDSSQTSKFCTYCYVSKFLYLSQCCVSQRCLYSLIAALLALQTRHTGLLSMSIKWYYPSLLFSKYTLSLAIS